MKTDSEKQLREDLLRAAIPLGFQPNNLDDLDRLLDTVSAEPFSAEQIERILGKMEGTVPTRDHPASGEVLTNDERELLALYRNRCGVLPPDIQLKIDAIKTKLRDARKKGDG